MFYIVVSDLDGTLLSSDQRVGSFTKQTLQILISRGIHVVFATGRHYRNVIKICDDLKINSYMITSNGTRVYDNDGVLIFSHDFDENVALDLFDIVYQDSNIITNVFRDDEWFVNRVLFNRKDCLDKNLVLNPKIYQQGRLSACGICKIYFASDSFHRLLNLEKFLNRRWGDVINVSFSLPMCLEVMPGGISKGYALGKVVDLLGYRLQDCISFGDGMNDCEMLEITGKGCIMRNAQQRLKNKLPFLEVIGSNDEEAVSYYLRKMYLIDNVV